MKTVNELKTQIVNFMKNFSKLILRLLWSETKKVRKTFELGKEEDHKHLAGNFRDAKRVFLQPESQIIIKRSEHMELYKVN